MISRKMMDDMDFSQLQAHIKNHEEELEMMKKEATRRAELVEAPHRTPTVIYLLEKAMNFYRSGYLIKTRDCINLAKENLNNELQKEIS